MDMRPHTPGEIKRWTQLRAPHEREPAPEPGERLLFREEMFGPVLPAVVHDVQHLGYPHDHWHRHGGLERARGPGIPDPHVWRYDEDRADWALLDDPWPWVQVMVITDDGEGGELAQPPRWCREARVRGSAGWLRRGSRAHTGKYEE